MTANALVETRGLTIRFGGLTAVNAVDFSAAPGETVGLIGPNGSGKTTFLNLLTGIYQPTDGEIRYQGENLVGLAPFRIALRGIARTFQTNRLFLGLSVIDNVLIGMQRRHKGSWLDGIFRRGRAERELRADVTHGLDLLGQFSASLAANPYQRAADLPQGERRKLEICRALAADPQLLLLDEPSVGMTPDETRELMADIRRVRQKRPDIAIILIEHDMSVIRQVTQRVVVLNYGRKVAQGTFEEVSRQEEVLEAYLGREPDA